jgi:hypothetical protein
MISLVRERLSAIVGILYFSAGFVLLMGVITAETKYPVLRHYTTRQEISDLGGTRAPQGLARDGPERTRSARPGYSRRSRGAGVGPGLAGRNYRGAEKS